MIPQLIELVGRRRTEVSVEFLGSFVPEKPAEDAQRTRAVVENRLLHYDRQREAGEPRTAQEK